MRHEEWKALLWARNTARAKAKSEPWWKEILKSGAAPLITALIGYGVGVVTEGRQQETYERRLYLEQRMKLFLSTATNFTGYVENLERLNTISLAASLSEAGLTPEMKERRDRYEKDRTAARERLWADLEQAQLFFSPAVAKEVTAFRSFFEKHQNATLKTMPPKIEYVRHKEAVLVAMRNEVRAEGR